jgi:hypothetical protein
LKEGRREMAKDKIVVILEKELKHAENEVAEAMSRREKIRAALNALRKVPSPGDSISGLKLSKEGNTANSL